MTESHGDGPTADVALLRVSGVSCAYGPVVALRHVSLEVWPDEVVCVLGVNGAGKTSLLGTIAGAVPATEGRVSVGGTDVTALPPERIVQHGVVLVPEGRQIFGSMTVEENLILGGYRFRKDRRSVRAELEEVYDAFPVLADSRQRLGGGLSGGEQQMLAVGRALMARPRLLMLDEPSLGLAPRVVRMLMEMVGGLARDGRAVLLVEQLARVALNASGRGYLLESGRVALSGSSQELQADDRVREIYMGVR